MHALAIARLAEINSFQMHALAIARLAIGSMSIVQ